MPDDKDRAALRLRDAVEAALYHMTQAEVREEVDYAIETYEPDEEE
jgi:hypothetical protein